MMLTYVNMGANMHAYIYAWLSNRSITLIQIVPLLGKVLTYLLIIWLLCKCLLNCGFVKIFVGFTMSMWILIMCSMGQWERIGTKRWSIVPNVHGWPKKITIVYTGWTVYKTLRYSRNKMTSYYSPQLFFHFWSLKCLSFKGCWHWHF